MPTATLAQEAAWCLLKHNETSVVKVTRATNPTTSRSLLLPNSFGMWFNNSTTTTARTATTNNQNDDNNCYHPLSSCSTAVVPPPPPAPLPPLTGHGSRG